MCSCRLYFCVVVSTFALVFFVLFTSWAFFPYTLLQPKPRYAVTIAVSSRTLFNMVYERKIYEEEGMEKYVAYQLEHENEPLKPGAAFPFVKVGPLRSGAWLPESVITHTRGKTPENTM